MFSYSRIFVHAHSTCAAVGKPREQPEARGRVPRAHPSEDRFGHEGHCERQRGEGLVASLEHWLVERSQQWQGQSEGARYTRRGLSARRHVDRTPAPLRGCRPSQRCNALILYKIHFCALIHTIFLYSYIYNL